MNRVRWTFAMVAALALGAACRNDPTGGAPRTGRLTVRLTTPSADDGAMTFEVTGAPIDSVVVANPSLVLFTRRNGASIVGAVAGTLAGGAVVTLYVPDGGVAAGYSARVLEVADRQDLLRGSIAGYTLTVEP